MNLTGGIARANEDGRLGLIVYVIPGHPTLERYRAAVTTLERSPHVSCIEMTVPVAGQFSDYTNAVIRDAHAAGLASTTSTDILERPPGGKPRFCVLYRELIAEIGYAEFLKRHRGAFEGVVLEFWEDDLAGYAAISNDHDVELIFSVGLENEPSEIERALDLARPKGLVYLACAGATGGEMFDAKELSELAASIKKRRPDVYLAGGLGVRTAEHVARLAAMPAVDAAIVGTAAIEAVGRSQADFERYLDELGRALPRVGR